ncbi:MAG TPA: hypothetical protein VKI65_16215 [Gemmataceae bacterium]|nr:hypothetical protein [Gemmataceae bacterium]
MRYRLGRFLQLLGLALLPVAIAGQVMRPEITLWHMLGIAGAGVVIFYLGWLLQRGAPPG